MVVFGERSPLPTADGEVKVNAFAVPFAVDWNEDGHMDLLVGAQDSRVYLYLGNAEGILESKGPLRGKNDNYFGDGSLYMGHNAAPVVIDWNGDGKKDLLVGQIDYGIPYPIDSDIFPYKEELEKGLKYVLERHIPIIPHMHLHRFKSDEQERTEIALHKQAFQNLGIPWDDDIGVDHHTWKISDDALRTFSNQQESGNPFILFSPAPHAINYQKAWSSLAQFDIPLTNFEHIEQTLTKDSKAYQKNYDIIEFMNEFKDKYEYNFMTEVQMARSLLNSFYADVDVKIEDGRLALKPDYSNVPDQAKEYAGTLGVKIELGEKMSGQSLDTSSLFYYQGNEGFYVGV
jgi:hypothetical protein